jgi:hypothetical protein
MPQGNHCEVEVWGWEFGARDVQRFMVAPKPLPALVLDRTAITRSVFYPRVRDGYRDATTVRYHLNHRAAVTAKVVNADGATVNRVTFGERAGGVHRWTWNGKRRSGSTAGVGVYRIELTAVDRDGHAKHSTLKTRVATEVRAVRGTAVKRGYWWTHQGHSSGCYVNDYEYDYTTQLDCWAGKYAWVSYRFRIPASARKLHWSVTGRRGCCSEGSLTKSGSPGPRSFTVTVKATGWKSYTIHRVAVSYTYNRRF